MTQQPKTLEEWQAFTKQKQAEKATAGAAPVPAPVMDHSGVTKVVNLEKLEYHVFDLQKRVAQLQDGSYGFSNSYTDWRPRIDEMLGYLNHMVEVQSVKIDMLFQKMELLASLLEIDLMLPEENTKNGAQE